MKMTSHIVGEIDCHLCKHLDTDGCLKCTVVTLNDKGCSCHLDAPCQFCEGCLYEPKNTIPVFVFQNGRRKVEDFICEDELYDKWIEMKDDCILEAEILTTGEVSQTISIPNYDVDYDIEITSGKSSTENREALVRMLSRFNRSDFDKFLEREKAL